MLGIILALPTGALACSANVSISAVQGTSAQSPYQGKHVRVIGVVTGDFTARDRLKGFFIEAPAAGATPGASRGLFVYAPERRVRVGERVEVSGRVREYHGMTEISPLRKLTVCDNGEPATAIPLNLSQLDPAWLEAHEGMLVRVTGQPVVAGLSEYRRYGTLLLAPKRQFDPTQQTSPGRTAYQLARQQVAHQLLLDDGSQQTFPPMMQPAVADGGTLRVGDRVLSATAVLDYRFGHWRLQPVDRPRFSHDNPRPAPPSRRSGIDLRVVSFNLENFFNGDGQGGGFPTARGAASDDAYQHQRADLVAAIQALSPDILGVMELENDGFGAHSAVADLSHALGHDWAFITPPHRQRLGDDKITVGLLYRRDKVTPVGTAHSLTTGPFAGLDRPPLWQRFRRQGGATLAVVVNHFKSRLCGHAEGEDRDQDDGQGCWNATRTAAAQAEVRWLQGLPRADGTLIIGDLNSYSRESSVQTFIGAGYGDLVARLIGANAYSYVYDGRSGYLDYALADKALSRRVDAVTEWHIDADEDPSLARHRTAEGQPWRASDHDPLVIDLLPANAGPD